MIIPQDIVERLNDLRIEEVAKRLGLEVSNHRTRCFMHTDNHPSMSFSIPRNMFTCWVCKKSGGPITLVREKLGLGFQDACVWLAEQFNILLPSDNVYGKPRRRTTKIGSLQKTVEEARPCDIEVYTWLIDNAKLSGLAKKFLFEERHFRIDVIRQLRIKSVTYPKRALEALVNRFGEERCLNSGLVKQGEYGLYFFFYTPCLLFPYFEQDGKIAGIQSRYLGDNSKAPRFQFLSSQKTRLFNLPVINSLKRGERLYISEGITDCLALLSSDIKAVAIPSATILPLEDLIMLKYYDLHMYPDQDEAGQKALMELRRFFVNHDSAVKEEKLPDGLKDYCDYYIKTKGIDGNK